MQTKTKRKRPKSPSIRLIEESVPWILIAEAAQASGLSELLIRNSGIFLRPFGNADYVRPKDLNAWINGEGGTAVNLDDVDPINEITKAVHLHRQLADQAKADLETALPVLTETLSHQSGQSAKVAAILQSCWNGELCDNLASLDTKVAKAVIAMIAARAHLGGDADPLLATLTKEGHQS